MKTFPTITSLKSEMKTNEVRFLDNDQTLPYVLGQDKLYHYFAQNSVAWSRDGKKSARIPDFVLVMTSSKDLQTEKEIK